MEETWSGWATLTQPWPETPCEPSGSERFLPLSRMALVAVRVALFEPVVVVVAAPPSPKRTDWMLLSKPMPARLATSPLITTDLPVQLGPVHSFSVPSVVTEEVTPGRGTAWQPGPATPW